MLKHYWQVTKPGIVCGNLLTFTGGFLFASKGHPELTLLLTSAVGISLVIASACVLNNCFDRDLDRLMARTHNRVLAQGLMSPQTAIIYALILGTTGMVLLLARSNLLSLAIVLAGFVIYAGTYTLYLKRRSVHATLIGSLAGAAPPVAGYCAASGHFDMNAAILLLIFSLWQMPHFYAIAIYRLDDYVAAAIPVLPAKRGIHTTKKHIAGYLLAFVVAMLLLELVGDTGDAYLVVATILGAAWLFVAWSGYTTTGNEKLWARRIFISSLLIVSVLSITISLRQPQTATSQIQQRQNWRP